MHLVPRTDEKVFAGEENATLTLDLLAGQRKNPIPTVVLKGWESRLAKADRLLSIVEIEAATNTKHGNRQLVEALQEFGYGDQAASRGEYFNAILHYASAYRLAANVVSQ